MSEWKGRASKLLDLGLDLGLGSFIVITFIFITTITINTEFVTRLTHHTGQRSADAVSHSHYNPDSGTGRTCTSFRSYNYNIDL